ncbi:MAG: ABC transporter ATP-binding protein [Candidatus Thermoplasmatota archaeon]|nr:ABC transporter ATP-binding protein [Candidatus Thermoplasmatota archaeon]
MTPDLGQVGPAAEPVLEPVPEKVPAVVFDRVGKTYGRIHALSQINLAISGGVTGILGLNGAGKSTLFNLLMGRCKPTTGQVRLFGIDPWQDPTPYGRVGFVPESEKLHDWMTAFDFVTTFARLHGFTRDEAKVEAERVLDFVNLKDVMHTQIGRYSKGMRQRVKIAHALVNDPDLIVLDEPLTGCDPLARTTIMNVVRELGRMGRTVLVSSHILGEIERITEQIVLLHRGQVLALGNVHGIREQLDRIPHRIHIHCGEAKRLAKSIIDMEDVHGVMIPSSGVVDVLTHDLGAVHQNLPALLIGGGFKVTRIENPDDDLESVIGHLVGGGGR